MSKASKDSPSEDVKSSRRAEASGAMRPSKGVSKTRKRKTTMKRTMKRKMTRKEKQESEEHILYPYTIFEYLYQLSKGGDEHE